MLAYFVYLTIPGLCAYFTHDDLMNIYKAWSVPFSDVLQANLTFWSTFYRPLGSLFYASFFDRFGLDPFPYRLVCYTLVVVNLVVVYAFARLVANSVWAGVFTAAISAYHGNAGSLYYSSGFCYDIFAFFFYYVAFSLYVKRRAREEFPGLAETVLLAILFILAINSKEIAVTLPAMLIAYEILLKASWTGLSIRRTLAPIVLCIVAGIYAAGKVTGAGSLSEMTGYDLEISADRYISALHFAANEFLYRADRVPPWGAPTAIVVLLGFALLLRHRLLLFAWALLFIAPLPITFIPPRGIAAYYIPLVGLALYCAILLDEVRVRLAAKWPRYAAAMVFVPLLIGVTLLHRNRGIAFANAVLKEQATIRDYLTQFRTLCPKLNPGDRLLVRGDQFGDMLWASTFIIKLVSRDDSVEVKRLENTDDSFGLQPLEYYTHILTYEGGKLHLDAGSCSAAGLTRR